MIRTITEGQPVARKPHHCEECGRTIPKGASYIYQTNTDGGNVWAYKAHIDCSNLSIKYRSLNRLWNDDWMPLYEHVNFEPEILDRWRGLYPHAICRFELTEQKRES